MPAERARTVAGRSTATASAPGVPCSRVLAHAVTGNGQVLLVVPADGPFADAVAAAPGADLSTLVMVSDPAPVPLRRSVRAQLWLSGWATPVLPAVREETLLAFAEVNPAGALLDVGGAATLLRLDLAEVVLGEVGARHDIGLQDFLDARPDPLAALEADTLRHLDRDHPEFLGVLAGLLPEGLTGPADVVRPLGVDRWGFRLRIERPTGSTDVRVPFPRPLTCAGQLGPAIRHLRAAAGRRAR
jgi:hypothetical protein